MFGTDSGASVKQDREEITILAVDDERNVVELTAELLEREDERFTVVTETSARDGLERLAAVDIDCVVGDYDMPRMNGLEFLRMVREEDCDLPFILFTGKGSEEIASEAISAGVTDYLQKGSGTERYELLANRIDTAVSQHRTENRLERQNELFGKTQDIANVGAWEYDPQTEEAYFIKEVYKIYGVEDDHEPSPEEDIQRFYHPEDRERVREAVRRALKSGDGYDIEVRLTAADGTDKWVRTRADPYLADGEVVKVRGTIRDITERKEQETRLERKNARLSALFEQFPEPTLSYAYEDGEPYIRHVNEAFIETFGVEAAEAVGEHVDSLVVPPEYQEEAREIDERVRAGETLDEELRRQANDGLRNFLFRNIHLPEDDEIDGYAIYTDIADAKERERKLERERERYRSLFENNPLVIWEEDFSAVKDSLDDLADEVSDIENYLLDHPEELNRLLGQIDIIDINRSALEYYNAPSKDALLENFHQIFPEEARETLAAAFASFAHGATRFRDETVTRTIDGERKHELLEAFVPAEYADDYSRVYVTGADITERKEQEQTLEKEREFIEQSLDTLDDIFYLVDTNGDFERWNSTLPERTGYTADEIGLMNALEFFEGEHREAIQTSIRLILETGSHVTEAEITTADGRTIPHEFRGVRMTDNDGNPTGIIGIARDITERKQREERLIRQNEQLEEFVGVVSHDLRNPLNVAESRLSLAAEECDSEHLTGAADAITRSQALIEDLLRLAREEEEVTEVEPLELADVAEDSWETVETGSAKLNLDTTQVIHADRSRLQQLFENLYRNAVEHGGDEVAVNVGDAENGFYIADTGPGIPESDRNEVFEAGYSTADDGTGFGLRIVAQIAEAHGWEIRVVDSADGGARFEITGVEIEG